MKNYVRIYDDCMKITVLFSVNAYI